MPHRSSSTTCLEQGTRVKYMKGENSQLWSFCFVSPHRTETLLLKMVVHAEVTWDSILHNKLVQNIGKTDLMTSYSYFASASLFCVWYILFIFLLYFFQSLSSALWSTILSWLFGDSLNFYGSSFCELVRWRAKCVLNGRKKGKNLASCNSTSYVQCRVLHWIQLVMLCRERESASTETHARIWKDLSLFSYWLPVSSK